MQVRAWRRTCRVGGCLSLRTCRLSTCLSHRLEFLFGSRQDTAGGLQLSFGAGQSVLQLRGSVVVLLCCRILNLRRQLTDAPLKLEHMRLSRIAALQGSADVDGGGRQRGFEARSSSF